MKYLAVPFQVLKEMQNLLYVLYHGTACGYWHGKRNANGLVSYVRHTVNWQGGEAPLFGDCLNMVLLDVVFRSRHSESPAGLLLRGKDGRRVYRVAGKISRS